MTDVAEIARGLTKAQQKRLEGIHKLNELGLSWSSKYGDVSLHTSKATTRVLLDMGLIESFPMTSSGRLTRTGLAVRDYLKEQQG